MAIKWFNKHQKLLNLWSFLDFIEFSLHFIELKKIQQQQINWKKLLGSSKLEQLKFHKKNEFVDVNRNFFYYDHHRKVLASSFFLNPCYQSVDQV